MKNLLAGLLGTIIGTASIVFLMQLPHQIYPEPFDLIWFIFQGSEMLLFTFQALLNFNSPLFFLITWIIVGLTIAPFSKRGWNTVRSALWVGGIQGILALISVVLTNADFWDSASRNIDILLMFSTSLIVAQLSLIGAYPISVLMEQVKREDEIPMPAKIETRCQCGAVFKSNPLICSQCGSILRNSID